MQTRPQATDAANEVMAHLDSLAWEQTDSNDPHFDWYHTVMHMAEHWWAALKYGHAFDWGSN